MEWKDASIELPPIDPEYGDLSLDVAVINPNPITSASHPILVGYYHHFHKQWIVLDTDGWKECEVKLWQPLPELPED